MNEFIKLPINPIEGFEETPLLFRSVERYSVFFAFVVYR